MKEFIKLIKADNDYKKNDLHQAILNISYDKWQNGEFHSYSNMVYRIRKMYGDMPAFAILIGKYNQQVCNGGHEQYFDNGYASSGEGGFFTEHDNQDLHDLLYKLFTELILNSNINNVRAVNEVLKQFKIYKYYSECDYCDNGYTYEEDEEGLEVEETCNMCGGSGEGHNVLYAVDSSNALDDEWYNIEEEFLKAFNLYLIDWFNNLQKED